MIRYALRCEDGHAFDGWFRDSATFDVQLAAGEVVCPQCGGTRVAKALMAPAVGKGETRGEKPAASVQESRPEPAALAVDPKTRALVEALQRLRRHVVENADYVGPRFAEEARKIHYEETERRDIYGEASLEETRALLEEGIEVAPLPALPEDKN